MGGSKKGGGVGGKGRVGRRGEGREEQMGFYFRFPSLFSYDVKDKNVRRYKILVLKKKK